MSAIGFGIGAVPEIRLVALLFWRTEPPHFLLLSSSKGSFLHHENSPKDFNFWFWLFRFIALVYEEIEGCPFPGIVQIKRIHFKGGLSSGWLCIAILNFHSPQLLLCCEFYQLQSQFSGQKALEVIISAAIHWKTRVQSAVWRRKERMHCIEYFCLPIYIRLSSAGKGWI